MDLSENKIANVIGPQDPEDFQHLESLRMIDNDLKDWSSIDQLSLYPSLKSLWIEKNPIMAKAVEDKTADNTSKPDARTMTIARMPHVINLNGSEVSGTRFCCC